MRLVSILMDALRSAVSVNAVVYALAGVGLNIQFGYGGLLNFGQAAFMLAGAYSVALVVVDLGMSMWIGIPLGLLLAVGVALLFGLPSLRLRADYLAIVTISTAEILRLVIRSSTAEPVTHGVFGYDDFAGAFFGVNPIPVGDYGFGTFRFSERTLWVLIVGWVLVVLAALLVRGLLRSPWGRVLRAMRDDEDATRSLGKNVFAYKLQALILGGGIAALAGMLRAIDTQSIRPDFFTTVVTFTIYTALILGGKATTWGPVLGSVILWFLVSLLDGVLRLLQEIHWIGLDDDQLGAFRFALVGLALIVLIVFRPQGLLGRREDGLLDA